MAEQEGRDWKYSRNRQWREEQAANREGAWARAEASTARTGEALFTPAMIARKRDKREEQRARKRQRDLEAAPQESEAAPQESEAAGASGGASSRGSHLVEPVAGPAAEEPAAAVEPAAPAHSIERSTGASSPGAQPAAPEPAAPAHPYQKKIESAVSTYRLLMAEQDKKEPAAEACVCSCTLRLAEETFMLLCVCVCVSACVCVTDPLLVVQGAAVCVCVSVWFFKRTYF
jgi:hypothetical protein